MSKALELNEDLLKEVFTLLSCSTDYEAGLAYDEKSNDYWQNENLEQDHKVSQTKREFALDALRGVLNWMQHHHYTLVQEGEPVDISEVLNTLIQKSEEEEEVAK